MATTAAKPTLSSCPTRAATPVYVPKTTELEAVPVGPLVRVRLPEPVAEAPDQVALPDEDQEAGGQEDSEAGLTVMVMLLVEPVPETGIQGIVMVWMLVSEAVAQDGEVEPVRAPAVEEVGDGVEEGKVRVGKGVQVAGPVEAEAGEADGLRDGVPRVIQVRLPELEGMGPDEEVEAGP